MSFCNISTETKENEISNECVCCRKDILNNNIYCYIPNCLNFIGDIKSFEYKSINEKIF